MLHIYSVENYRIDYKFPLNLGLEVYIVFIKRRKEAVHFGVECGTDTGKTTQVRE